MINNNPLLGRLLSTHRLADYRRHSLITCGMYLLLPFICGILGFIGAWTNTEESARGVIYVPIGVMIGSVVLFGLLGLVFYLAPYWQKKAALEIYENGFVQREMFGKTQTCLWSEIREVDLSSIGFENKGVGIYKVYKNDGSKINVSRLFEEIELIEERLIHFCDEPPN